jgi:hypothetical protein
MERLCNGEEGLLAGGEGWSGDILYCMKQISEEEGKPFTSSFKYLSRFMLYRVGGAE